MHLGHYKYVNVKGIGKDSIQKRLVKITLHLLKKMMPKSYQVSPEFCLFARHLSLDEIKVRLHDPTMFDGQNCYQLAVESEKAR